MNKIKYMDNNYLLLALMRNDMSYWHVFMIIISGIVFKNSKYLYTKFMDIFVGKILNKKEQSLLFEGFELLDNTFHIDYPVSILAVSFWCNKNKFCNNMKYINIEKNNDYYYYDNGKDTRDINPNYILQTDSFVEIDRGQYKGIKIEAIQGESVDVENNKSTKQSRKYLLEVKSEIHKIKFLEEFVQTCINEYEEYIKNLHSNILYHFIYKGSGSSGRSDKLQFVHSEINNIIKPTNFESFRHIHNEHKEKIMRDIDRLHDKDYYRENGLKRKKGYLFYGHPGCGKTYTVMAMANYDNRHILEIPMSRVKTNKELEEILNLTEINGIKFTKDKLIILFDEFDMGNKSVEKRDFEKNITNDDNDTDDYVDEYSDDEGFSIKDEIAKYIKPKEKKEESKEEKQEEKPDEKKSIIDMLMSSNMNKIDDSLHLGTLLSRLDGIGNYNGLILVATTNYIDKISPALYRYGRLDPVYFDFARKEDIKNMIESFYKIKLSEKELKKIPDRTKKLAPSYLRKMIEQNEYDYKELLNNLSE